MSASSPPDSKTIRYAEHGRIGRIEMSNPPINALSYELRRALMNALDRATSGAAIGRTVTLLEQMHQAARRLARRR